MLVQANAGHTGDSVALNVNESVRLSLFVYHDHHVSCINNHLL